MPTALGSVRRFVMTPKLIDVTFAKRGFPAVASAATRRLEAIPQAVICGFEWGIDARDQWEVERRLDLVDREQRGFAYEGATMAFTILDATGRGHRTRDLLRGPGRPHIFLAYIGMGFAMARLPRPVWKKVLPDLSGDPYYPVMSWLAVDGYGFDRAYFDTRRWVDAQRVPKAYPWAGSPGYFPRAVDQGIGRALWFICGGSAPEVAAAAGRFASHRQADLWSGIGGRCHLCRRVRRGGTGSAAAGRRRIQNGPGPRCGVRRQGARLRRFRARALRGRLPGTNRRVRRQGGKSRRRHRGHRGARARIRAALRDLAAADTRSLRGRLIRPAHPDDPAERKKPGTGIALHNSNDDDLSAGWRKIAYPDRGAMPDNNA